MNSLEKIQTHVTRNHGNTETFKQLLVLMETEISAVMSKRRRERVNSMGELIDVLVRANRIDVIRNIVDCLGDDHELKRLLSQLDQELKRKDVTGNNEYRKWRPQLYFEKVFKNSFFFIRKTTRQQSA